MSLESFVPDAAVLSSIALLRAPSEYEVNTLTDTLTTTLAGSSGPANETADSVNTQSAEPSANSSPLSQAALEATESANRALHLVDELDAHHKKVAGRTSLLHAECKRLLEDESRMRTMAERIYKPLAYFESLYVIGKRLGVKFEPSDTENVDLVLVEMQRLMRHANSGSGAEAATGAAAVAAAAQAAAAANPHRVRAIDLPLTAEDEDFPAALDRLEECVSFFASHPAYVDAMGSLTRAKAMIAAAAGSVTAAARKAMEEVCTAVGAVLQAAHAKVDAAHAAVAAASAAARAGTGSSATGNSGQTVEVAAARLAAAISEMEALEMTELHIRFRTQLAPTRLLLQLLEVRAGRKVYAEALGACYNTYGDLRLKLMMPLATARLQRIADEAMQALRAPAPQRSASAGGGGGSSGSGWPASDGGSTRGGGGGGRGAWETGSVATADTSFTAGTRATTLWSTQVTDKETVILKAVRSCATVMARAVQAEHSLFHSLFTARTSNPSGSSGSSRTGGSAYETPAKGVRQGVSSGASVSGYTTYTRGTRDTGGTRLTHGAGAGGGGGGGGGGAGSSDGLVSGLPANVRAAADGALTRMQDSLCGVMTDTLRPLLLRVTSVDVLCDIVHVLREELLAELLLPRGPALAPLAAAVTAFMSDVQERLVFRAQAYISERVEGYTPSAAPVTYALNLPLPLPSPQAATAAGIAPEALAALKGARWTRITVHGHADVPSRLLAYYARMRSLPRGRASSLGTSTADAGVDALAEGEEGTEVEGGSGSGTATPSGAAASGALPADGAVPLSYAPVVYDTWLPVLEDSLVLLSKLHRCLDRPAFESIAQEAVATLTDVLLAVGTSVQRKRLSEPDTRAGAAADAYAASRIQYALATSGTQETSSAVPPPLPPGVLQYGLLCAAARLPDAGAGASAAAAAAGDTVKLDAQLFVIKNLLVLREQLSPFDVVLQSTHKRLNFRSTTDAVATLLSRLMSVFRLDRDNALLSFVTHSMPTVEEETLDFKARLEALLKSCCTDAIAHMHGLLMAPLLPLLAAAAAAAAASAGSAGASEAGTGSKAASASSTSAPTAEAIVAAAQTVRSSFLPMLIAIRRRLGLHLGSPLTASILFKPVREAVAHTVSAARKVLVEALPQDADVTPAQAGDGTAAPAPAPAAESSTATAAVELVHTGLRLLTSLLSDVETSEAVVTDPLLDGYGYDKV